MIDSDVVIHWAIGYVLDRTIPSFPVKFTATEIQKGRQPTADERQAAFDRFIGSSACAAMVESMISDLGLNEGEEVISFRQQVDRYFEGL